MADCLGETQNLIDRVIRGRCACIARHWKRLWKRGVSRQFVQKQMDDLDHNFYDKFLKWLYAVEAATFEGSRLLVMDILSRFPLLSEKDRKKLTVTEFLENLSRIYGEIIAAAVSGKGGLLKVKLLELNFLSMSYAEQL